MNPLGEQVACLTRDLNHQSKTSEGEKTQRRRRKKVLGDGLELKKNRLTVQQVAFLEKCFGTERKLESGRKIRLASELGLDPKQVAVWFQNRRARWKNKKIEEECVKLKKIHESVMLEKCQLEVTNLKRQLSEVEKDIRKLSQASDGAPEGDETGNSTSSSFSMDPYHPFIEEYAFGEFESFSYTAEPNYINVFDWGGFI